MTITQQIVNAPPLDWKTATASLRRAAHDRLDPDDLAAEIQYWAHERDSLTGDLAARDFTHTDEAGLVGGIAYAEARLLELERQADRLLRARARPGYLPAQPRDDLGPRFAAAKWVDAVAVIETLTGQTAIKGGDGYRIRCPWHEDRRPSLVIFPPGRGWHCFVCNKGNDVVGFVAELQHTTAVEALFFVEHLTDTAPAARKIAS